MKSWGDSEEALVAKHVVGNKIWDLGSGDRKTVPHVVGMDIVLGDSIATLAGNPKLAADVTADASSAFPFDVGSVDTVIARHVLEHISDPITAVTEWKGVLKQGGRLIITVPDQAKGHLIPMNVEQPHAWDAMALDTLLTQLGFRVIAQLDPDNGVSFVTIAEKL